VVKSQSERIALLEDRLAIREKQVEEHENKIEFLDRERNLVVEELKRCQEKLQLQENDNKKLIQKDIDTQVHVKSLTQQLEDTVNKLHDLEKRFGLKQDK
jgi:chromosome segregation ATPase